MNYLLGILIIVSCSIAYAQQSDNPFTVINNTTVAVDPHTIDQISDLVEYDKSLVEANKVAYESLQVQIRDNIIERDKLKKKLDYDTQNLDYARSALGINP